MYNFPTWPFIVHEQAEMSYLYILQIGIVCVGGRKAIVNTRKSKQLENSFEFVYNRKFY